MSKKITRKTILRSMMLKVLFYCVMGGWGVLFSGIPAFADGPHADVPQTTADEAYSAGDEDTMKNFVLHMKQHLETDIKAGLGASALYRQMRQEPGDWNKNSVYLIVLNRTGTVSNHGKYTASLFGSSLAGLSPVKELLGKLGDAQAGPVCEKYEHSSGSSRWSCAVLFTTGLKVERVLIGGFDHAEDATGIVGRECPDFKPEVTASDVDASRYVSESRSLETLEAFVKGAIKRIDEIRTSDPQAGGGASSAVREAIAKAACLAEGHWKSGPIYLFVMYKLPTGAPIVILNGNNQEFTGSVFEGVYDEDGVDIGEVIIEAAGEDGEGGIVRYKWDNPLIGEDDVAVSGMSPGRSPKISYVEGFSGSADPGVFIFGSGVYGPLEGDSGGSGGSDGDDGCALAGIDGKASGTVFNLLLIVFSVFLASRWKVRSKE